MITINRWHYSLGFFVLSLIIIPFTHFFSPEQFQLETSVWCFRGSKQTTLCKFKNVCYDSQFKAFLFLLSENSVIKGFDHYNELQKIELSSVQEHNQFYANISVIDIKNYKQLKKLKIHSKAILLSRFKPNNLMHNIHDDLFPLYLTLESVCLGDTQCMESYDLIFHDNHPKGPFFYLYELFSNNPPILLNYLETNSHALLCFKEMLTGLVKDGIFYQYGFKKSHGPIKSIHLTQNDISRFTLYVKNKLKIFNEKRGTSEIILLNRQKNRKILNVKEVKKMIKSVYEKLDKKIIIRQINLDLYSNDIKSLLKIISQADGLIGMHGAEMILSLFLKPNSFVLEIFPFGINPDIVSFIKPVSEMDGCNFVYFFWKNLLKNNSIPHPDAPPLFGGIFHLDEKVQMNIKNTQEVPAVECCNNPLFLYHMYQDTFISDNFENFFYNSISKILNKQINVTGQVVKKWFHPYIVYNVSCIFDSDKNNLNISWNPPFNIKNYKDLMYNLYIKDHKGLFSKNILTKETTLQVKTPFEIEFEFKFDLWISVYFSSNNFRSSDLYVKCN